MSAGRDVRFNEFSTKMMPYPPVINIFLSESTDRWCARFP